MPVGSIRRSACRFPFMIPSDFQPPPTPVNFTIIKDEYQRARYIVGHDQFQLGNFTLTSIFHRELTSFDDFLLGILSVIIIAILSDLAHTILLRTTSNRVSPAGIFSAFLVNEATHLRNVLRHFRRHRNLSRSPLTNSPALISAVVLMVLILLFAADVLIVVITQPRSTVSGKDQFNIRAVQPITTKDDLAKYIRRLAGERVCVTPIMNNGSDTQTRRYLINACLQVDRNILDPLPTFDSGPVSFTSFFHRGGSDHNISYPAGSFKISIRVQALLDTTRGGPRRLLFDTRDDATLSHARYLHTLSMYRAKQYVCSKKDGKKWCNTMAVAETKAKRWRIVGQDIKLWRGKEGDEIERARGVESVFDEQGMPLVSRSINSAVRVLIASAGVEETTEMGLYQRTSNDKEETGVADLLEENGRIAGVALMGLLTVVALALMMALRIWLKPQSLGTLAVEQIERELQAPAPGVANAEASMEMEQYMAYAVMPEVSAAPSRVDGQWRTSSVPESYEHSY